jgi:hypothetical protein
VIRIRRLPAGAQRRILDQISLLAGHDFAGRVQRPFITAVYTGRDRAETPGSDAAVHTPQVRAPTSTPGRRHDSAVRTAMMSGKVAA